MSGIDKKTKCMIDIVNSMQIKIKLATKGVATFSPYQELSDMSTAGIGRPQKAGEGFESWRRAAIHIQIAVDIVDEALEKMKQ